MKTREPVEGGCDANDCRANAYQFIVNGTLSEEGDLMNSHKDFNNLIKEQKDVLLRIYEENHTHVRHYEDQRSRAANIIIIATVGLVGLMAAGGLKRADWLLCAALIVLGFFGAVFTTIHYECICYYKRRTGECSEALEALLLNGKELTEKQVREKFEKILRADDWEHQEKLPKLRGIPFLSKLRALWPLTISMIGILLLLFIIFFNFTLRE